MMKLYCLLHKKYNYVKKIADDLDVFKTSPKELLLLHYSLFYIEQFLFIKFSCISKNNRYIKIIVIIGLPYVINAFEIDRFWENCF